MLILSTGSMHPVTAMSMIVNLIILLSATTTSGFNIAGGAISKNNARHNIMKLHESKNDNDVSFTFEELINGNKKKYDELFPTPPESSIAFSPSIFFNREGANNNIQDYDHDSTNVEHYTKENASVLLKRMYGNNEDIEKKPIALFLPGLDGVGLSACLQFPTLTKDWDLWRMAVDPTTSSQSYLDLTDASVDFLNAVLDACDNDRPVYLIGESFGGLLTTTVALRMQQQQKSPQGIVLINPATSFDETSWSNFVPLIQLLQNNNTDDNNNNAAYSVIASTIFSLALADSDQWEKISNSISNGDISQLPSTLMDSLQIVGKKLPPATLQHRLKTWLPVGTQLMTTKRLKSLEVPTLIIVGDQDKLLPSGKEVRRLAKLLPNSESLIFRKGGHMPFVNQEDNLSKLILNSKLFFPKKNKKYDPIKDWSLPTADVIENTIASTVKPVRDATSPVFFSSGPDGERKRGLSLLPSNDEGPVLYVANHQLLGLDLGMIIAELLEERDIIARGLAHPFIFQNKQDNTESATTFIPDKEDSNNNNKLGSLNTFDAFGAVMVSPRNYYRLMQTGQTALLFPGGVREVFHGKDEAYQLFWPEDKVDFVRTAAKFNATIVPLSAVGAADSANILMDAPDMQRWFSNNKKGDGGSNSNITAARYDQANGEELFQPPLVVPKIVPARHYFVFGTPMSTKDIDHKDKENCKILYDEVQKEMYRGFDDILYARDQDPYADSVRRIASEWVSGKQAPTFPIDLLNRKKVADQV